MINEDNPMLYMYDIQGEKLNVTEEFLVTLWIDELDYKRKCDNDFD